MPFETLTSPQKVIPAAAAGIAVTLAASWGAGAWVEIEDSTVAAWILAGLTVGTSTAISASYDGEFDVGVGGAGSEVVKTQFRFTQRGTGSGGHGLPQALLAAMPLDNIGSGVRVAIRGRKDTTTNRVWSVRAMYLEKPITGTMTTTAKPTFPVPSAANISITPNAADWVNSAWVEIEDSTAAALVITTLIWQPPFGVGAVEVAFDLGKGGAGSEAVIDTVKVGLIDDEGCPNTARLWPPLDNVGTGVRLAIRMRKTGTDTGIWRAAVEAVAKPL